MTAVALCSASPSQRAFSVDWFYLRSGHALQEPGKRGCQYLRLSCHSSCWISRNAKRCSVPCLPVSLKSDSCGCAVGTQKLVYGFQFSPISGWNISISCREKSKDLVVGHARLSAIVVYVLLSFFGPCCCSGWALLR